MLAEWFIYLELVVCGGSTSWFWIVFEFCKFTMFWLGSEIIRLLTDNFKVRQNWDSWIRFRFWKFQIKILELKIIYEKRTARVYWLLGTTFQTLRRSTPKMHGNNLPSTCTCNAWGELSRNQRRWTIFKIIVSEMESMIMFNFSMSSPNVLYIFERPKKRPKVTLCRRDIIQSSITFGPYSIRMRAEKSNLRHPDFLKNKNKL